MNIVIFDLIHSLESAIETSGFPISGPTDFRAADNGEPVWVCNARAALSDALAAYGSTEAISQWSISHLLPTRPVAFTSL